MTRTSKALKRLGVAGVAVATIGAGVPAFFATAANAAVPATGISLTPDTANPNVGTCTPFTATVAPVAQNVVVDVNLSPRNNTDQAFCTLSADGKSFTAGANPAAAGLVDNAEFTTDANGQVKFGVISTSPGVIDVTAFVEDNGTATDDAAPDDANEVQDTSVVTVSGNGTLADVTTVDAEPETGSVTTGQLVQFTVTTTNANGQPVSGAAVYFDVTSGPNAAVTATPCTVTDQTGSTTCSYTAGPGTGTDTIVAYVNNTTQTSPAPSATLLDSGDTQDTITRDLVAALAAGASVDLMCANGYNSTADTCQVPLTKTAQVLTAVVKNLAGATVSGAVVEFSFVTSPAVAGLNTGQAGPEAATTGANAEAADSLSPTSCVTGAAGSCSTTLTNPAPRQGDTINVRALVRTGAGTAQDTTNVIYRNPDPAEARNLTLTPDAATTTVGNAQGLTVLVVDRFGNPVANVDVTLTETGTGRFADGSSSVNRRTNAAGQATADVVTTSNETPGSTSVTATIIGGTSGSPAVFTARGTGTADDECEQPANTSLYDATGTAAGAATGNQPGTTAGDCDDVSIVTFAANNQQSPTATPTSTVTPPACQLVTTRVNTKTINATGLASATVTGAKPGSTVQIQGYSQNHFGTANFDNDPTPVDRTVVADNNGSATVNDFRPASNTRLRARMLNCTYGGITSSDVINVRAMETLQVSRNGVRKYTFSGVSIPARPGGLIVSLYKINGTPCAAGVEPRNCPTEVLIGQDRAEQGVSNGSPAAYSITLTLPASYGSSGQFVVKTGQDAQNAPGRSNARTLSIF